MCFHSENHSLLFHACQRIAGLFFEDAVFSNSGRSGKQQAALGLKRCSAWFDTYETTGLSEFNSATYMPITLAALLNVYDLCGDKNLSERAGKIADRIFSRFALHTFKGVTTAPQGRVYDNVLYPESDGAQAIISFASLKAIYAFNSWISFPVSSNYKPPNNLDDLIIQPQSISYREGPAYIKLYKTKNYCLSSVQLPNPLLPQEETHDLFPQAKGYQQHTAHATLGPGCHILVNHPGGFYDGTFSRPGYWYGHTDIPKQHQQNNKLVQHFNIDTNTFIDFTHIHWPSDSFDYQSISDHWLAGAKDGGCIAVWCSSVLKPHNDRLTNREFRAYGRKTSWVWHCGNLEDYPGSSAKERLENFLAACKKENSATKF